MGKENGPPHHLLRSDMQMLDRASALRKKGLATKLWLELQLALPDLRAISLIPAPKTVDSSLAIMSIHGVEKMKFCGLH